MNITLNNVTTSDKGVTGTITHTADGAPKTFTVFFPKSGTPVASINNMTINDISAVVEATNRIKLIFG